MEVTDAVVRPEPEGLCPPMRVPRPPPGPHLGRRSPGEHRHLAARHRHGLAFRRRLARAHGGVRDPRPSLGHRRHDDRGPGHRHLRPTPPTRLTPASGGAEIARATGIFGRRLFPGAATQGAGPGPSLWRRFPPPHTYLIGASRTAAEILRQQMVLNAIHDAGRAVGLGGRQRGRSQGLQPRPGPRPRPCRPTGLSAARPRPGCRCSASCSSACTWGAFPHGRAAHAHAGGRRYLPFLLLRARVAPELGAALRGPPPDLHGRGRRSA